MKSLFRLLVVFLLTAQLSFAQKTVTGVVSDPDGLPLPGATVIVQGTTTGVTTDFDGNFSINVSEGQTLEFSFVGYETAAVAVEAPETAANPAVAKTVATARPPGTKPIQAFAQSYSCLVIPA